MNKLLAFVSVLIVCAAPALAQVNRTETGCTDPQTTGSLSAEAPDLRTASMASIRQKVTPPEESWQEQAREDAERRRRGEAEGCSAE